LGLGVWGFLLGELFADGGCECLRHEEFDHFKIGEVGVTVKVDFVGKKPDGTLVLTDRETGRDDDDYETEPQMAVYVLWAMQYYRMRPDDISTELVFLKTGGTKQFAFFWEQLHDVEELIRREYAAMNASYEYGDFPARPTQRECLSCKFAEVCPEAGIARA
jgi:RecB family exonuclease